VTSENTVKYSKNLVFLSALTTFVVGNLLKPITLQKPEDLFGRYIWFVNILLQAGDEGLTLAELNEKWLDTPFSGGTSLSRTTFNRYRDAIEEMFGIITDCNRSTFTYRISNPEILHEAGVDTWMLRSLTVAGVLQSSVALHDRIVLETMPSGQEFLQTIIDAMAHNHIVQMKYLRSFALIQTFNLMPYCLKVFKQRWYLVGHNTEYPHDDIRVYGLDRILGLKETEETFTLPYDFNPQTFFENDYGVYTGSNVEVEDIVIRAYGRLPDYLRSLPLHHSQREIATAPRHADFVLHLRPTYDFMQELLSQANELEILAPESLRKEYRSMLRKALNRNSKKDKTSEE